jgi:hypothetical protein
MAGEVLTLRDVALPGGNTRLPGSMTAHQIELVEHALRLLAKLSQSGWDGIPQDLQSSFSRYMSRDCWTGEPDLLTLRDAALMVLRDAVTRTGEFAASQS